jgi:hypothetical protein
MMQSKSSGLGPSGSLLQFSDDDLDAVLSTLLRLSDDEIDAVPPTQAASQLRAASTAAIDLTDAEVAAVRELIPGAEGGLLAQLRRRLLMSGDTGKPDGGADEDTSNPSGGAEGDARTPGDGGHNDTGNPGGGGGGPIVQTSPTPGKG